MSFLFISDDIMSTTGYVNMTAEELRRLRKSILRRMERLAETHIRPVTQEGEKAWVHLRDVMTRIILQVKYPGQGLVFGLFVPEGAFVKCAGLNIISREYLELVSKYDWEKFGPAFMDALKEAERVLLSERRMIEAETEQARKRLQEEWIPMFVEDPEKVQNTINQLYKDWQPVAEDAKAVKPQFPDRMQPGESKASEALRRSGKEISWENIDEVISAENTYIREFEAVVMEHFGITPEIFDNPPPTIDQGISWWRRRLHLPEEHEGASRIRLEEQVIEDLVAE
jgi:hypothetical protein